MSSLVYEINMGVKLCTNNRMHIPQAALIPVTSADVNKARDLLKRPYICEQPHWKHEVQFYTTCLFLRFTLFSHAAIYILFCLLLFALSALTLSASGWTSSTISIHSCTWHKLATYALSSSS